MKKKINKKIEIDLSLQKYILTITFQLSAPKQHFRLILAWFEASLVFPTWFALQVYQNMTVQKKKRKKCFPDRPTLFSFGMGARNTPFFFFLTYTKVHKIISCCSKNH